jgi:hypothetical protein
MAPGAVSEPGSGKLETPCERMHLAYSTSNPPGGEPAVGAAADADADVVVGAVVVPTVATPAPGEAPPQAAKARASTLTARPMGTSRQRPRPLIRIDRGATAACLAS